MKFCEKCGNILVVEGDKYYCKKCNKKFEKEKEVLKEIFEKERKKITVMGKRDIEKDLPITQIVCPNCGNKEAYWWTQQTRSADEPATLFYKCTKCNHTWRSYS